MELAFFDVHRKYFARIMGGEGPLRSPIAMNVRTR
jgi:hypothetical protein